MTGIFHQAGVGAFDDFPRIAIGQVHQFQIGHFIPPWRLSDSADGISGIGGSQTLVFHATVRGFCWWSSLPISACIQAGLDGGSEYFLIEQDDTYGRAPYESLKISHDNLVRMGCADWF